MSALVSGIQVALLAPVVAATTPATGAVGAGGTGGTSSSLIQYVLDGGLLGWVLIALSIVSVALMVRNAIAFRYRQFAPAQVMETLETMLSEGRLADAERFCKTAGNECFVSTVLGEAIRRARTSEFGMLEFRASIEEAARSEADEVHRMNDGLGVIAAVGPMLGLLGTVIGMIGAFRTIGGVQGTARSSELATFMSMALVNTAEGLVVAIPATVAFALFRRRIDRILHRLGREFERFASVATAAAQRPAPARAPAGNANAGANSPGASPVQRGPS